MIRNDIALRVAGDRCFKSLTSIVSYIILEISHQEKIIFCFYFQL